MQANQITIIIIIIITMVNVIAKMFSDPMVTLIKIIRDGIGRTGKPVLSLDDEQEALYRWCSSAGLSRVH